MHFVHIMLDRPDVYNESCFQFSDVDI